MCKNKLASKFPYYHLLPAALYKGVLKKASESKETIKELLEIKETGISIERFNRILRKEGFSVSAKQFYLINPIYKYKFNLKVRKQNRLISAIPWLRNYFTTTVYYLVQP